MGRFIDLSGQRFGRLTVMGRAYDYISPTGRPDPQWECECDCGGKLVVRGCHLRNGHTKSCGCYQLKRAAETQKKFNLFRVEGEAVYVKLSNSEKEMVTDLDVWEGGAKKYCWALEPSGYASACIDTRRVTRRFHVYAFPDCPPGMVRDHIDGNRLNNTRKNIRFVRPADNSKNCDTKGWGISGRRGIAWTGSRWLVTITVDKITIKIGYFSDLQEAIAAREAAEIKYFGEYRRKK